LPVAIKDPSKIDPRNRWVNRECPHTFHVLNIDILAYQIRSGCIRFFDWKNTREEYRKSQRDTFPVLEKLIELGIANGVIKRGGVYLIEAEPVIIKDNACPLCGSTQLSEIDFSCGALVTRIINNTDRRLTKEELKRLIGCEKI